MNYDKAYGSMPSCPQLPDAAYQLPFLQSYPIFLRRTVTLKSIIYRLARITTTTTLGIGLLSLGSVCPQAAWAGTGHNPTISTAFDPSANDRGGPSVLGPDQAAQSTDISSEADHLLAYDGTFSSSKAVSADAATSPYTTTRSISEESTKTVTFTVPDTVAQSQVAETAAIAKKLFTNRNYVGVEASNELIGVDYARPNSHGIFTVMGGRYLDASLNGGQANWMFPYGVTRLKYLETYTGSDGDGFYWNVFGGTMQSYADPNQAGKEIPDWGGGLGINYVWLDWKRLGSLGAELGLTKGISGQSGKMGKVEPILLLSARYNFGF